MKRIAILMTLFILACALSFGALTQEYQILGGDKASVYDLGDTNLTKKISSTDLIETMSATVTGDGWHEYSSPKDSAPLTNGLFESGGVSVLVDDNNDGLANTPEIIFTYTFLTTKNILEILIFAGHDGSGGDRAFIDAKVETSTNGTNFTVLEEKLRAGVVDAPAPSPPAGTAVSFCRLYDDAAHNIANGVLAVRISIYSDFRDSAYRERDYSSMGGLDSPVLKEIDILEGATAVSDWNLY